MLRSAQKLNEWSDHNISNSFYLIFYARSQIFLALSQLFCMVRQVFYVKKFLLMNILSGNYIKRE